MLKIKENKKVCISYTLRLIKHLLMILSLLSLLHSHITPQWSVLIERHIKFFKLFTFIDQAMLALEGSLKMKCLERQIKIYVPRFSIKYNGNVKIEI